MADGVEVKLQTVNLSAMGDAVHDERKEIVDFIRGEADKMQSDPTYGLMYSIAFIAANSDPLLFLRAVLGELADELEDRCSCLRFEDKAVVNVNPV